MLDFLQLLGYSTLSVKNTFKWYFLRRKYMEKYLKNLLLGLLILLSFVACRTGGGNASSSAPVVSVFDLPSPPEVIGAVIDSAPNILAANVQLAYTLNGLPVSSGDVARASDNIMVAIVVALPAFTAAVQNTAIENVRSLFDSNLPNVIVTAGNNLVYQLPITAQVFELLMREAIAKMYAASDITVTAINFTPQAVSFNVIFTSGTTPSEATVREELAAEALNLLRFTLTNAGNSTSVSLNFNGHPNNGVLTVGSVTIRPPRMDNWPPEGFREPVQAEIEAFLNLHRGNTAITNSPMLRDGAWRDVPLTRGETAGTVTRVNTRRVTFGNFGDIENAGNMLLSTTVDGNGNPIYAFRVMLNNLTEMPFTNNVLSPGPNAADAGNTFAGMVMNPLTGNLPPPPVDQERMNHWYDSQNLLLPQYHSRIYFFRIDINEHGNLAVVGVNYTNFDVNGQPGSSFQSEIGPNQIGPSIAATLNNVLTLFFWPR